MKKIPHNVSEAEIVEAVNSYLEDVKKLRRIPATGSIDGLGFKVSPWTNKHTPPPSTRQVPISRMPRVRGRGQVGFYNAVDAISNLDAVVKNLARVAKATDCTFTDLVRVAKNQWCSLYDLVEGSTEVHTWKTLYPNWRERFGARFSNAYRGLHVPRPHTVWTSTMSLTGYGVGVRLVMVKSSLGTTTLTRET